MKLILKVLSVFLVSLSITYNAQATHLMGGEITAIQLHDSTYLITLTTYRDTLGIPMDSIANFTVKDTSGIAVMTFSIPYDTIISGSALRLYPYGVEVYLFQDSIKLPGSGTFHISFTDCCRNGAIQNLSHPLNDNMYLTTTVTHFDSTRNSTPFFLVQPVIFLPRNTSWAYNPLPFDLDGDSMVWSLDTPLTAFNTPCAGYSSPASTTGGGMSINSVTGSISWTASTIGNFDATVLVEEYRNGVKIGEIRRDMQFIVVNPIGSMARMTNMNELPEDNHGNNRISLNANTRYNFSFFAEDPDTGDVVSILAFGEPFNLGQGKRASFFTSKTGKTYGNEVEGTFIWKPTVDAIRDQPYIVVYRVSDGFNTLDYSVLYEVNGPNTIPPTGVKTSETTENSIRIFPNPAVGSINLELVLPNDQEIEYEIFNLTGQSQFSSPKRFLKAGNHIITQEVNLANGSYIIVVRQDNALSKYQKFQILK